MAYNGQALSQTPHIQFTNPQNAVIQDDKTYDYSRIHGPLKSYPQDLIALDKPIALCDRMSPLRGDEWTHLIDVASDVRPLNIQIALANRVMKELYDGNKLIHFRGGRWTICNNIQSFLPMLTTRSDIRKNSGWQNVTRDEWLMTDGAWDYIWGIMHKITQDSSGRQLNGSSTKPCFSNQTNVAAMVMNAANANTQTFGNLPTNVSQNTHSFSNPSQNATQMQGVQMANTQTLQPPPTNFPMATFPLPYGQQIGDASPPNTQHLTKVSSTDSDIQSKRHRRDSEMTAFTEQREPVITRGIEDMIKATTALTDKSYFAAETVMANLFSSFRLTNHRLLTAMRYLELQLNKCQDLMAKVPEHYEMGHRRMTEFLNSSHWQEAILPPGEFRTTDTFVNEAWNNNYDAEHIRQTAVGEIIRRTMDETCLGFADWEEATESIMSTERHGYLQDNYSTMIEKYRPDPLPVFNENAPLQSERANLLMQTHHALLRKYTQCTKSFRRWLKQKRPPTADTASVGPDDGDSDDDDLDTVDITNFAADVYDPNKSKKNRKVTVAEAMTWPEHWSAQEVIERIKQEERALVERLEEEDRLKAEQKSKYWANIRVTDEWYTDNSDERAKQPPMMLADWWEKHGLKPNWSGE
jgi:hypothetical protein